MATLPRVAIGTVQGGVDLQPMLWAVMDALRQRGLQVQSFLSRACFARYHGEAAATGVSPRHLDSWLMPPQLCREVFVRGSQACDLAIVEGEFAPAVGQSGDGGGRLDPLCEWLDLPRIAVLDVSAVAGCELPQRTCAVDGLLLDGVADDRHLAALTTNLEALWNVPVLGALPALPDLRAEIAALPGGIRPSRDLCEQLSGCFLRIGRLERLLELAACRDRAWDAPQRCDCQPRCASAVVAVAYDDALNCYFPDTLDVLESLGAQVVDFSPLHDERLPEGATVVYLGCGHPERYAAELSHNHCMKLALRSHLRNGGRIYAEGGGLAYLCEELETADGGLARMAGIFPAIARLRRPGQSPAPVEVTLDRPLWLGQPGETLRGYRNPNWYLGPAGKLNGCVAQPQQQYDVVQSCRAIGSQLHLDFVAAPQMLPSFFQPRLIQPGTVDPWAVTS